MPFRLNGNPMMPYGSRGRITRLPSQNSLQLKMLFLSLLLQFTHLNKFTVYSHSCCAPKSQNPLRESQIDLEFVKLHTTEFSDVWIRDYGPTFVINRALKRSAIVRWNFNAWGGKYEDQVNDGRIPTVMNRRLGLPQFVPGIVLEGGSIDVNGRGTVLTTRSCLLNPNRNPSLSSDTIEEFLKNISGL